MKEMNLKHRARIRATRIKKPLLNAKIAGKQSNGFKNTLRNVFFFLGNLLREKGGGRESEGGGIYKGGIDKSKLR